MWNVKCIWYGFEIYSYLKTFHTNITTTNDLKKSSFVGCSATPGWLLDEVPVQSAVEGVVAPVTRQTSLPGSPACNTRMRSWGTTSYRLCRTTDQGFCYSTSSCFQSRCRMNSRSETSTPCPGQPFPLICHQLNMCHQLNLSGTSRKRRLQQQLHPLQLYRIFVKETSVTTTWNQHRSVPESRVEWSNNVDNVDTSGGQVKQRERTNITDIWSCEEILDNVEKGSFSAMAWAIERVKGVEEVTPLNISGSSQHRTIEWVSGSHGVSAFWTFQLELSVPVRPSRSRQEWNISPVRVTWNISPVRVTPLNDHQGWNGDAFPCPVM